MFSTELLHLIYQFFTLGICQDQSVKQKALEQLQEIYLSEKKESTKLDYVALSQMYPEKICADSYMQKLTLINKI